MKRQTLYILAAIAIGLILGVLAFKKAGRKPQSGAKPAGSQNLRRETWKLPWELENTQDTAIANLFAFAQSTIRGFTPGTVSAASP